MNKRNFKNMRKLLLETLKHIVTQEINKKTRNAEETLIKKIIKFNFVINKEIIFCNDTTLCI